MRTITVERLRNSSSEEEVLETVREYVGDWLPEELGLLPEECRPRKVRDGEDLNLWAWNLTRACVSFDVDPEHLRLVEEMDAFVGQSCRRLAELRRNEGAPTVTQRRGEVHSSR